MRRATGADSLPAHKHLWMISLKNMSYAKHLFLIFMGIYIYIYIHIKSFYYTHYKYNDLCICTSPFNAEKDKNGTSIYNVSVESISH